MSHQKTAHEQYGTSTTVCDYIVVHQLEEHRPATIVDFGAGAGKNGWLARQALGESVRITAVEGFLKTAAMLAQEKTYDQVDGQLIQDWIATNRERYDLAIFGDVLEHLTKAEIDPVMAHCLRHFKVIIVICPLHEIFQDEVYGNELEIHHTYVTEDFFDGYGYQEKHIVRSGAWVIMNVLIDTRVDPLPFSRRFTWALFHLVVMLLQPFGLARPLVTLLKKRFLKYKRLLGR
jgi:hypothetical protein